MMQTKLTHPQSTPPDTPSKPSSFWLFATGQLRISRSAYLVSGVLAFTLKFALDSQLARLYHRPWGLQYYLEPSRYYNIWNLPQYEWPFFCLLVAMSFPFMLVGSLLTLGRIKDADLPSRLTLLFFVPLVNLPFFLFMTLIPPAEHPADKSEKKYHKRPPRHSNTVLHSNLVCAVIAALAGFWFCVLGFFIIESFGWSLFIAAPVVQGYAAAALHGIRPDATRGGAVAVSLWSCLWLGVSILVFQFDGLICLAMAAPLAVPLAVFGAWLGSLSYPKSRQQAAYTAFAAWLLMPGLFTLENQLALAPPVHAVTTSIRVIAAPEKVWNHVIEFPDLPTPADPVFRTGIAYPLRATIDGRGVGAVRYCEFSTGPFVEPVTVWDPPQHLAFDVTAQPPPMEEFTIFANSIHPPHLEDMLFVSHRGEFRLTPQPDGSTIMAGTTWYSNGMLPTAYWKLWSDWIIHRIHLRVLDHIKQQAETKA